MIEPLVDRACRDFAERRDRNAGTVLFVPRWSSSPVPRPPASPAGQARHPGTQGRFFSSHDGRVRRHPARRPTAGPLVIPAEAGISGDRTAPQGGRHTTARQRGRRTDDSAAAISTSVTGGGKNVSISCYTRDPDGFPETGSDLDIDAPESLCRAANPRRNGPLVELVETFVSDALDSIQTWRCCHSVVRNHPGVVSFRSAPCGDGC